MKLLFLVNIPSPYRVAFFDELARACDLTVLYERKDASNRDPRWITRGSTRHYRQVILKGVRTSAESSLCVGVLRYVLDRSFDLVVLGGYSTPTAILAIAAMRAMGVRFILNADGGFIRDDPHHRRIVKRHLIGSASGWLSTGTGTTAYLQHYGADARRCMIYPFSSVLATDVAKAPASNLERNRLRAELGILHERVVLSVGRPLGWKGFDVLIRSVRNHDKATGVYIVGGAASDELRRLVAELGLQERVVFVDFQTPEKLRKYYRAADVFATATRDDIWGLVVNEAMAQGLPVVATDRCGAALEMVADGVSGRIVPVDDVVAFGAALQEVLYDDDGRLRMGEEALATARGFTIEAMAARHLVLLESHMNGSGDRHGRFRRPHSSPIPMEEGS